MPFSTLSSTRRRGPKLQDKKLRRSQEEDGRRRLLKTAEKFVEFAGRVEIAFEFSRGEFFAELVEPPGADCPDAPFTSL